MYGLAFQAIVVLLSGQTLPVTQVSRYATAWEHVVETEPLPFHGRRAKERSTLLFFALVHNESGFREAIERCEFRTDHGWQDNGKSAGLPQLYQGRSWQGHTREQICTDVELQFRLGFRYLTAQVKRCGSVEGGLSGYNANQCARTAYAIRTGYLYERLVKRFGF